MTAAPILNNDDTLLQIDITSDAAETVLRCAGEIDLVNLSRLENAVFEWAGEPKSALEIDLRDVRYFDSLTLGVLLKAHRLSSLQGRTFRVRVSPDGMRLIRLARLDGILNVRAL